MRNMFEIDKYAKRTLFFLEGTFYLLILARTFLLEKEFKDVI